MVNMNIQKDIVLAPFTTFGIGGPADCFFEAKTSQELVDAISWARERYMPYFVLGSGANILIGDKGFRGLVIKNEAKKIEIFSEERNTGDEIASPVSKQVRNDEDDKNVLLMADAGVTIADLIDLTAQKGLSGLEHFAGIPSTLGGALWQNLHFLSSDRTKTMYIGDIVTYAKILTENGEAKEVDHDYFQFGYDSSILHTSHDIVLSATLKLTFEDPKIIQERVVANKKWRNEKHPFEAWKNSAGSIFKKNENFGAGRLIEQVGLKGHKIGGAQISEKHANFIVNTGGATAQDVVDLITLVKKKIQEKLGLEMVTEISFVGEF